MKAIVIYEKGGPEKLIYTEVPTPEVREGWSLVKVQGFGINHSEVFTREGQSPSVTFPRILGIECVGVIDQTTDAGRLPVGQQVISIMGEMGRAFDGGYAEYVLLPNEQIYPVESDLPIDRLAALPETYYTAYGSMKNLRIQESDQILVRGATSGVGIAFMKLVKAKYPNTRIVGTSRRTEKAGRLLEEGFDGIIIDDHNVLRDDKFIKNSTMGGQNHPERGMKFDKVLDLLGPAALRDTFLHMKEGSTVCCTGLLGGVWTLADFDPLEELPADSYLTSFHSGHVTSAKLQEMIDYVEEYKVPVKAEKVFSLSEVPKAHEYLDSADSFGKVVVVNDP